MSIKVRKNQILDELEDISFRIKYYAKPYVSSDHYGYALLEIRKVQERLKKVYDEIAEVGAKVE